ncbi:MAG: hypothetical protein AMXMBFR58_36210 [Phycisphaerae bacterium]|nr:hypothetical protein [Phycisphaerales bacterium]MCK6476636.1 hypothetical protein [Phycisphaerales bacterium]
MDERRTGTSVPHRCVESDLDRRPVLCQAPARRRRPKPRTRRPAEALTDAEVRALLAACGEDAVGVRHRALLAMI